MQMGAMLGQSHAIAIPVLISLIPSLEAILKEFAFIHIPEKMEVILTSVYQTTQVVVGANIDLMAEHLLDILHQYTLAMGQELKQEILNAL